MVQVRPKALEASGSAPAQEEDFDDFFRRVYPRLARAALLLTGDIGEAEDLAQEAMARALERWERVRAMESPEDYAFRTAMNINSKRLRAVSRWARRRLPRLSAPDPADDVLTRRDVLDALRSLPLTQREALVLVGWVGLSSEEAGEALGIDADSVRGRVHRARASLRRFLETTDE